MRIALATLIALVSGTQAAKNGKCRVMAFSSGDESAAYQAGALKGITTSEHMNPEDYAYDSVSGISGGAINAVLLANYK
jgi:predicted acylesterase/phospholipase RssA